MKNDATASQLCEILSKDYCTEFDEIRKNRVLQSHFKYGWVSENYKNNLIEAIPSLNNCLVAYEKTGNTEYLVDAANYLMFEYMFPQHENAHFEATSSDKSAGIVGMGAKQMEDMN